MGVRGGGALSFGNSGKFGQGCKISWAFLSRVLGIGLFKIKRYDLLLSFVLDFLVNNSIFTDKKGQPPHHHKQVSR